MKKLIAILIVLPIIYLNFFYVKPAIDEDFVAWSNSMPKEEAEIQLRDFLSTFNSWDEAKIG